MSDVANAPGRNVPTGGGATPITARPGAPTSVTATPANRSATVTWAAPTDDGGSAITSYTVTSSAGQTASVNGALRSATVSALSNGTAYTFTVRATNGVGNGPASAPSNSVVPTATPAPAATAPAAPTGAMATGLVSADRAVGVAAVSWSAPSHDGGNPISSYLITATPGGGTTSVAAPATSTAVGSLAVTAGAAERSATLTGLDPGTDYAFSVVATNEAGASQVTPSSTTFGTAAAGRAGYWMVGSDGTVTGMVRAGTGYLMVGEDGGIFDCSGDPDSFKGSLGANPPAKPITSVAVLAH